MAERRAPSSGRACRIGQPEPDRKQPQGGSEQHDQGEGGRRRHASGSSAVGTLPHLQPAPVRPAGYAVTVEKTRAGQTAARREAHDRNVRGRGTPRQQFRRFLRVSSPSDPSTRIRSGRLHEALTIASNAVRATATRKPRPVNCRERRRRDSGSASAMSTRGSAIETAVDGTAVFSAESVCNCDIGHPLGSSRGVRRARTLPLEVEGTADREDTIEADGDDDAPDDCGRVHVGRLAVRIERRQKQQTGQAAHDAARDDFRDDVGAALGTAMALCKVALALRTSRH